MSEKKLAVMVDIETLGRSEYAVITEIGAVLFDCETGDICHGFYVNITLESNLQNGRVIDAGTVCWWQGQWASGAPMKRWDDGLSFTEAMAQFCMWGEAIDPDAEWWFNGCSFDPKILGSALGERKPWKFWQERDQRTMRAVCGIEKAKTASHDALEDCKDQVKDLVRCLKVVEAGKKGGVL